VKYTVTLNEGAVMKFLAGKDFTSPTEIGSGAFGLLYNSSKASPICLRLVKKGLLERSQRGHYRIIK